MSPDAAPASRRGNLVRNASLEVGVLPVLTGIGTQALRLALPLILERTAHPLR